MDHVAPAVRSKIMAAVKSKNTSPELVVRKALHRLGYRFALHSASLPGKPDLVFRYRRKIILIHGCFWHGHACRWGRTPKTNRSFWRTKVDNNRARDRRIVGKLRRDGWSVMTVWQCQTRTLEKLVEKMVRFLESR